MQINYSDLSQDLSARTVLSALRYGTGFDISNDRFCWIDIFIRWLSIADHSILIKFIFLFPFGYVPTLLFWTGGSHFERAAPALQFLPKVSHFEMSLTKISDIYEFFKSVTLFTNSMWKSWQLITKSGACVALLFTVFIVSFWFVSTKPLIILALAKAASRQSENQYNL